MEALFDKIYKIILGTN